MGQGTEIAKRDPTQPALPRWSRSQIDLLKRTVAKGLTDDELQLFVYVCRRTGLDPFLKQVYAIKRWDSEAGDYRMAIQVGIDGLRLQASRPEAYAGSDPPEFELNSEGFPIRATVTVYRIVNGERCGFTGEARWAEYAQRKKDGGLFVMWEKMPYNQLAKCAEAQALRKGFPAEVQGLMIHEEMPAIEGTGDEAGTGSFAPATLYEGRITLFRLGDPKKKRPGQIAVAVEGRGMLGPLGFWDVPEAFKDQKPEEAVGVHVQISYAEITSKKGGTYKNLSHLAVKAEGEHEAEVQGPGEIQGRSQETQSEAEAGDEGGPGQAQGGSVRGLRQDVPPIRDGLRPHERNQAQDAGPLKDSGVHAGGSDARGEEVRGGMRELPPRKDTSKGIHQGVVTQPPGGEPPGESSVQYWKRNLLETKSLADLKALWDNLAKKGGRYYDFTKQEQQELAAAKEKRKAELGGK